MSRIRGAATADLLSGACLTGRSRVNLTFRKAL